MPENITELLSLNKACPMSLDFDPHNISSFPKSAIPTWITTSTINGIIAPPTFFINLLVSWTVLESERLRSTNYNLMLAILSITDLMVGLVVQPLFISLNVCIILQCTSTCNLTIAYTVLVLLCVGWSGVTMVVTSLERYLSVEYPLYYNTNVTKKKLIAAIAISWFLVAVMLVLGRWQFDDSNKIKKIPVIAVSGLSIVIIVFCLTKVNLTARRQMRAINAQQAAVQQTHQNRIKEYKRTFTLGIVVIAAVLSFCPLLIIRIIKLTKGKEWNDDFKCVSPSISLTFVHFQSLVNPLIFSLRLSHIRAGVIKKLRRFLG